MGEEGRVLGAIGAKVGGATNPLASPAPNPLGLGLGGRAGVSFFGIYAGVNALYYVGFHFAEAKKPLGEELLEEVVKKGGRTKVGKMAKNKLALLQGTTASAEAD